MIHALGYVLSRTGALIEKHKAACFTLFVVFTAQLFATPTNASEDEKDSDSLSFSLSATLASDYIFRGVSQTLSRPALHLNMDIEHTSGMYAYLWASNVDFVEVPDADDGARWELNGSIGRVIEISPSLAADLSIVRYEFPGTVSGVDYNYNEWIASIYILENYRITAGISDNVFGEDASAPYYEFSAEFDIPWDLYMSFETGYYDLQRAYLESYKYGSITIGRYGDRIGWALTQHLTSSSAENLFDATTVGSRLAASLHIAF